MEFNATLIIKQFNVNLIRKDQNLPFALFYIKIRNNWKTCGLIGYIDR